MYESFFGFRQRPFLAVPTLDRYFPASSMEQAIAAVTRCVQRGEGPATVIGGAGLGKTMCCLRLAQHFQKQFDVVALASSQICTRRALLQCLLYELRLPYQDRSEGELRLALNQRLLPSQDRPSEGLVLIVDEAQTLSTKLLDELRLITNVVHQGVPRVRLVLCGTMKLEDLLAHPHSESLNQRIASRSYLVPLNGQETAQYIRHKLEISGGVVSEVMTGDAIDALYRGSDGIPRLIDQLSDHALWSAAQLKIKPLNASIVGHAWSTLQQLPNPWSEPMASSFATSNSSASSSALASHSFVPPAAMPSHNVIASNRVAAEVATRLALTPTSPTLEANGVEFGSLDDVESAATGESAALDVSVRDSLPSVSSRLAVGPTDWEGRAHQENPDAVASPAAAALPTPEALQESPRSTSLFRSFLVRDSIPEPEVIAGSDEFSSLETGSLDIGPSMDIAAEGTLHHEEHFCSMDETVSAPVAELLASSAIASSFIEWLDAPESFEFETAESVDSGDTDSDRSSGTLSSDVQFSPATESSHDAERELEVELREMVSQIQASTMAASNGVASIGVAPIGAMPSADCEQGIDSQEADATSAAMVSGDDRDMIIIEERIQHVTVSVGKVDSTSARAKPSVFAKWF